MKCLFIIDLDFFFKMSLVVFSIGLIKLTNEKKGKSNKYSFLPFFYDDCMRRLIDYSEDSTDEMTELLKSQGDDMLIDDHEVFQIEINKKNK